MTTKNILFILCCLFLAACEPREEEIGVKDYLIRQGEHYATSRKLDLLQSERLRFEATFNHTAKYRLDTDVLQTSYNKLMGFSDCNGTHHDNSARFGWRWLNNRLEIAAYCYVNKQRVEQFVGVVEIDVPHQYEIVRSHDAYTFYLDGEEKVTVPRHPRCNTGVYYLLYPYFGGTEPAPHDITIRIKRKF